MSDPAVPILDSGMARVGAGTWLVPTGQPAAARGECRLRGIKGLLVPDRSRLCLLETDRELWCADATRPFLSHLPVAAPVTAATAKVLLAPADARAGGRLLRVIPLSFRNAICVTNFSSGWLVLATRSRTARAILAEGEVLTLRREAAVAWTTKDPTGFCPRLQLRDILLPRRRDRNLLLHFYGPGIVWFEGANAD